MDELGLVEGVIRLNDEFSKPFDQAAERMEKAAQSLEAACERLSTNLDAVAGSSKEASKSLNGLERAAKATGIVLGQAALQIVSNFLLIKSVSIAMVAVLPKAVHAAGLMALRAATSTLASVLPAAAVGAGVLAAAIGGFAVAKVAAGALIDLGRGAIEVGGRFEQMRAALVTATGSVQEAGAAFDQISDFAQRTPFEVSEITQAYIRLTNLGLEPTMERLESFGNIAGANSKSLMQFAEAVADASVAEFERLKEFGIKARNEGEKVAFTFRGVTERVQNDAASIVAFLERIGRTEFAGGMALQAATAAGAASNLSDAWSRTYDELFRLGIGEVYIEWTKAQTRLVSSFGEIASSASAVRDELSYLADVIEISSRVTVEWIKIQIRGIDVLLQTQSALSLLSAGRERSIGFVRELAYAFGVMAIEADEAAKRAAEAVEASKSAGGPRVGASADGSAPSPHGVTLPHTGQQLEMLRHADEEYFEYLGELYQKDKRQAEQEASARTDAIEREAKTAANAAEREAKRQAEAYDAVSKELLQYERNLVRLRGAMRQGLPTFNATAAAIEREARALDAASNVSADHADEVHRRTLAALEEQALISGMVELMQGEDRFRQILIDTIDKQNIAAGEQMLLDVKRRDFFRQQERQLKQQIEWAGRITEAYEVGGKKAALATALMADAASDQIPLTYEQALALVELQKQAEAAAEAVERALQATGGKGTQGALGILDAIASSSAVGDEVAVIAAGISDVITGLEAAKGAADAFGRAKGWQQAMAGIASIATALADVTGLLDRNVTAGGFGGRGEGNYAAEGSQYGAIVGAIIGGIVAGATTGGMGAAAGAQIGAAIGSAAGGILGSMVKKGADEAFGNLVMEMDGSISAIVQKNEAGLARVVQSVASRVDDTLKGILDKLGASIAGIPPLSVKVRDGIVSAWVGNVNVRVNEMDAAITFMVTEILKQSEITGLSDVIRQVLEGTEAIDLDQLAADLDFGLWYERLGLEEAAVAVEDQLAEFRAKLRKAIELGLDTAPIGEWLASQLQATRDQVLGIEEDPAERIRRQAEAFNQQLKIVEAEQLSRRADLIVKKASLEAEIGLYKAEHMLQGAHLEIRAGMLDAEAGLVSAEFEILRGMMEALKAVDAALAAVDIILASLPDLITPEEIDEAIGRIGRGGGKKAGIKDFIEGTEWDLALRAMGEYERSIAEINKKYDEQLELAGKDQVLRDKINQLRAQELALMEAERLERENEVRRDVADKFQEFLGIEQDPFAQLRKRHEELTEEIVEAGYGAERTARMLGRMDAALERQLDLLSRQEFVSLGDNLFGFLERYYGEIKEFDQVRLALEEVRFHLELENMRARFELLKAEGGMATELALKLGTLFEFIAANPPDFTRLLGRAEPDERPMRKFNDSVSDASEKLDELARRFASAKEDIGELLIEIAGGEHGVITSRQAYDFQSTRYGEVLAMARGGDITALEAVDDVARDLIEATTAFSPALLAMAIPAIQSDLQGLLGMTTVRDGNVFMDSRFQTRHDQQMQVMQAGFDSMANAQRAGNAELAASTASLSSLEQTQRALADSLALLSADQMSRKRTA